jgi:ABC-2 type transport system ATP-binding protein
MSTAPAITTEGLGKRYRRTWALRDCTLSVPAGRIVGLVGVNGAGKTTLLHLAAGLLAPTTGTVRVLGGAPAADAHQLARVGFLAQGAPLYASLTIADHLHLGRAMNPRWDDATARARVQRLGLEPGRRAGQLSGGQRAQVALAIAVAKRPDLLILDEPVASLDPLARREFLQTLMEAAADHETAGHDLTVVLSSHLIADLERVCDHLVVLAAGRVGLAGDVDDLLAEHRLLRGPRQRHAAATLPDGHQVVQVSHTDRQTTVLARLAGPVHDPRWSVTPVGLEDLVLAYMRSTSTSPAGVERSDPSPTLEVVR